jgi:hypothetical protein
MIDLKKIVKGKVEHPPKILIYGMDGIGKTTFAAGAPDPFFIDANRGSLEHDVRRVYPDNWQETKEYLTAVERREIDCKTLVLDSLTELELSSHQQLFGSHTIADYGGGWGAGKNAAAREWANTRNQLERIWMQGKAIIIIAHVQVTEFEDPSLPRYNRYCVAVRPELAAMFRQWVDHVLFCKEQVTTVAEKGETARAGSTGIRWIHTKWDPAYDAKSRGGMPPQIPLSWMDFDQALRSSGSHAEGLMKEIHEMLAEIGDAKSTETVLTYLKQWPQQLIESHNRVSNMLARHKMSQKQSSQPRSEA